MIAQQRTFKFGDAVIHAARPEWGPGTVTRVEQVPHNGQSAQRVHVRFPGGVGLKVINTAVAELRPASEAASLASSATEERTEGWLARLEGRKPEDVMTELPEPARDPFRTLWQRLEFTLNLYRFNRDPKSILEWAIAQSGLSDPMTRFTRQELETLYDRWARGRDVHLASLAFEAERKDPIKAREVLAKAAPEARRAVQRINVRR